ncbi:dentin sialophosphoprotein-like [Copidosoma floridanum]|uniref:dentin sialophosphoprotein-like n=1 Tax=Copidosoma floridanum TaxID=29053 RepID=UPI0006C9CE70|nr:dentin sialophosphoprotein-like [Copidosoma floridanum]
MRLSTILELLLIFLLIAFAAYGRVIVPEGHGRGIESRSKSSAGGIASFKQAAERVNQYCTCSEKICNCCHSLKISLIPSPACVSLQYLKSDNLAMQLSLRDSILSSNIFYGKNPKQVCATMPGKYTKVCGSIYSIKRESNSHFKACLGLELKTNGKTDARMSVSCFRFGPDGIKLRAAEPLPPLSTKVPSSSDDDYDDFFAIDEDDDDDDDDEEDEEEDDDDDEQKARPEDSAVSSDAEDEDEDDDDLLGFTNLFDILTGEEDVENKKKPATTTTTTTTLPSSFVIPILPGATSTETPLVEANSVAPTTDASAVSTVSAQSSSSDLDAEKDNNEAASSTDEYPPDSTTLKPTSDANNEEATSAEMGVTVQEASATEEANAKAPPRVHLANKLKKKPGSVAHKDKVSLSSQSANAIKNDDKKPGQHGEEDEDEDEYDYNSEADDSDEEEEETAVAEEPQSEGDDKKPEAEANEDDEDEEESEEEEDAVLSALVDEEEESEGEKNKTNKLVDGGKVAVKKTDKSSLEDEYNDESDEIDELLARQHRQPESETVGPVRSARQSKVMRF